MRGESKIETCYIGITGYKGANPVFTEEKVFATNRIGALTQFELNDIMVLDVMPYIDDAQMDIFDVE